MKFSIKEGKENVVEDALSRLQGSKILYMAISVPNSDLEGSFKDKYRSDNKLQDIVSQL